MNLLQQMILETSPIKVSKKIGLIDEKKKSTQLLHNMNTAYLFYHNLKNSIVVDALDDTYIQLKQSDWISKKSYNQGAFAKQDTPKGTVYSLYGGRVLTAEEKIAYDKLRKEQIQQVKDENSNNADAISDFSESTWMNM